MSEAPVGFLEEAPGVKSSTRLIALLLACFAGAAVGAAIAYLLRKAPDANVMLAFAGIIATLVIHGAVAIVNRTRADQSPPDKPC